jgi:hypothetical protein
MENNTFSKLAFHHRQKGNIDTRRTFRMQPWFLERFQPNPWKEEKEVCLCMYLKKTKDICSLPSDLQKIKPVPSKHYSTPEIA